MMSRPGRTKLIIKGCVFLLALLLVFSGITLLWASSLPFDLVRSRLDAISVDGSADVFMPVLFEQLVLSFRVLAVGLFLSGGLVVLTRRSLYRLVALGLDSCRSFYRELLREWREAFRREDTAHLCAFLIILLVAVAVRMWFLFQPMRHDESWTFTVFASRPLYVGLSNYSEPNNHLFHTFLVHLVYLALGNKPWVLRLPALASGVLAVPAWYLAIRSMFNKHAGLLTAALVASSSALIAYSANARGYTLIWLIFALLLALGQRLMSQPNGFAWFLFAGLSAMGFYTVPIMLYPFGIVVLWMFLSSLAASRGRNRARFLMQLGLAAAGAGLMTILLYMPVFVASGVDAVVSNRTVASHSWPIFVERLPKVIASTWNLWNRDLPKGVGVLLTFGFAASVVWHHRLARLRVPIVLAALMWCVPLMLIHRVAPPPKVWLFLLPLFLGLAAVGWSYFLSEIAGRLATSPSLVYGVLAIMLAGVLSARVIRANTIYEKNRSKGVEQMVLFLKDRLTPGDRVVARLPLNAPVVYYFNLHDVPMDYFVADPTSGRRLFAIVNEEIQTLEDALTKARGPIDNFVEPRVINQYRRTRLYQLRRID